jgi:NADPH-dependent glutamate synthase beta subunit-like oxidoreductase
MILRFTTKNLEADLIVIGGGGSGLSAALTAAEKGAKVIVLEKRKVVGGNAALAAAHTFAAESPTQRRSSVVASRDELFKTLMDWTYWKVDPRIVRAFIDKSGDTIRWLENKGIVYTLFAFYPNQVPLVTHVARGQGAEVIRTLYQNCLDAGVTILTSAEAIKILKGEKGEVLGILARKNNKEFNISGNTVVIATGGYGGNKELIKKYCSYYQDTMRCIGLPHMGDGLRMAIAAGAATEGLGMLHMESPSTPRSVQMTIDYGDSRKIALRLTNIAIQPDTIWVNKNGMRFMNEMEGYSPFQVSNGVIRQPDAVCFSLFDSSLVQNMTEKGLFLRGGNLFGSKVPGLKQELKLQADSTTISIEQADRDICNGCGICENSCPLDIIRLDTIVSDREESSSCTAVCPAHVDMRQYNYLLRHNKLEEALEVIRKAVPFPSITGRVCPHPCESECARKEVDEAVNINDLERFVADFATKRKAKPVKMTSKKKTAIIGSGPAGLSCAYYLIMLGYPVTIFESMSVLGGMLRVGIPEYRLPKKIVDDQITYLRDLGVEFKTGITIGKDITIPELQKEYEALFVATGNQLSRKINIKGFDMPDVLWGLDFLRDVNLGKNLHIKDNVVVIGAGNVAIDVALTALRQGAKQVQIACLERGDELPAYNEEIKQAINEGVIINEGWGPKQILNDGNRITGIELIFCKKVFDANGKFKPTYNEKITKILKTDMIILAIGQAADLSFLPQGLKISENSTVDVNPITLETSLTGIFAGGDIISAGGSVIEAIAAGHRAAISIDRYYKKENLLSGRDGPIIKVDKPPKEGIQKKIRARSTLLTGEPLYRNFKEIKCGFDEDLASYEAERCMTCGSRPVIEYVDECRLCLSCERNCPIKAISTKPTKSIPPLVKITDSWDEMAEWIGADPTRLKATIDEYNSFCDNCHDIFGKDRSFLLPLRTVPYYAIKCNVDFLETIGGIKINEHMEVIDTQGNPIPGLYAAGADTGGWEGDTYCVKLAGTTFSFALNSGRIAGENAVIRKTLSS